jgi:hypothetical protein
MHTHGESVSSQILHACVALPYRVGYGTEYVVPQHVVAEDDRARLAGVDRLLAWAEAEHRSISPATYVSTVEGGGESLRAVLHDGESREQ